MAATAVAGAAVAAATAATTATAAAAAAAAAATAAAPAAAAAAAAATAAAAAAAAASAASAAAPAAAATAADLVDLEVTHLKALILSLSRDSKARDEKDEKRDRQDQVRDDLIARLSQKTDTYTVLSILQGLLAMSTGRAITAHATTGSFVSANDIYIACHPDRASLAENATREQRNGLHIDPNTLSITAGEVGAGGGSTMTGSGKFALTSFAQLSWALGVILELYCAGPDNIGRDELVELNLRRSWQAYTLSVFNHFLTTFGRHLEQTAIFDYHYRKQISSIFANGAINILQRHNEAASIRHALSVATGAPAPISVSIGKPAATPKPAPATGSRIKSEPGRSEQFANMSASYTSPPAPLSMPPLQAYPSRAPSVIGFGTFAANCVVHNKTVDDGGCTYASCPRKNNHRCLQCNNADHGLANNSTCRREYRRINGDAAWPF